MCHQCAFAGLAREVSCLEFLQYCHSGRNLVITWESRAVGQAVKRRHYTAKPACQSRETFPEICSGWIGTGARLVSEFRLFTAAQAASSVVPDRKRRLQRRDLLNIRTVIDQR
jgi:hypothetical protein